MPRDLDELYGLRKTGRLTGRMDHRWKNEEGEEGGEGRVHAAGEAGVVGRVVLPSPLLRVQYCERDSWST